MSVSALSPSLTETVRSPRERVLQLEDQALASCEHLETVRDALGERARVEVHQVDAVVRMRRTVVEQRELPCTRFVGTA